MPRSPRQYRSLFEPAMPDRHPKRKGMAMALDRETRGQLIWSVRRFVTIRLRPRETTVADDDAVPEAILAEMRALGLFGLSIPETSGGLDLSMEDECLVIKGVEPATPTRLRRVRPFFSGCSARPVVESSPKLRGADPGRWPFRIEVGAFVAGARLPNELPMLWSANPCNAGRRHARTQTDCPRRWCASRLRACPAMRRS